MAEWRSMRASGADRERAADLLRAAHGDGRLEWQDYSTRFERLMSSTTHGEIHQVLADLIPESARRNVDGGADHDPATGSRSPDGYASGNGSTPRISGPGGGDQNRRRRQPDPRARTTGTGQRTGTDRLASAAVICGTLVPFTVGISGIPAILLGHMARRRLKRLPPELVGNSAQLATAALVLGYFPVAVGVVILLFLLGR